MRGPFVRCIAAGRPLRCYFTNDGQPDNVAKGALSCIRAGRSSPFFRFRLFRSFSPYASRALSGRASLPPLFGSLSLPRAVFRPSSYPDRRHRHYRPSRLSLPPTFSFSYSRRALASSVSHWCGCEKSSVRPSLFSSLRNDDGR